MNTDRVGPRAPNLLARDVDAHAVFLQRLGSAVAYRTLANYWSAAVEEINARQNQASQAS